MLIVHDPRCADYGSSMRPEQPARITRTVPVLQSQHPEWSWLCPRDGAAIVSDATLLRAHTAAHLRRLAAPHDFDDDTPHFPDIGAHARRGVCCLRTAAEYALTDNAPAFSLMRPPGHHATADQAMGFCYLNQIATVALDLQHRGLARRVAVWDFDVHHGNGTEAILQGRPDILFSSVHQSPGYPGTGLTSVGNCQNFPLPPHTPRTAHMRVLETSWREILAFAPDIVLISAGFDAYVDDPITAMSLETADFATLGRWLHAAPMPVAAALEGGYSSQLPQLIEAFLNGWSR